MDGEMDKQIPSGVQCPVTFTAVSGSCSSAALDCSTLEQSPLSPLFISLEGKILQHKYHGDVKIRKI